MDVQQFAKQWIEAWNSRNLTKILEHYSDEIEVTTPMIKLATGDPTGSLTGKQAVANYWQKALERLPDLHFELIEVTSGVASIAIYYKSVMGKKAMEVMFFNGEGKVNKMIAHYTD